MIYGYLASSDKECGGGNINIIFRKVDLGLNLDPLYFWGNNMNKILLIIENTITPERRYYNERIIQSRIKKRDFNAVYEIIFSSNDFKKISAFRRVNLDEGDKFDQRFYCSNWYVPFFDDNDFNDTFFDIIKSCDIDHLNYICGGDKKSVEYLESILEREFVPLNPNNLFD